jgi:porin
MMKTSTNPYPKKPDWPRTQLLTILGALWAVTALFELRAAESTGDGATAEKEAKSLKSADWLKDWSTQPYLLGDWAGWRTKLAEEYGVNFEFMYYSAVPTNLNGGLKTGSVYEGLLLSAMNVDTEKLLGWKGGTFYASSLWIHGQSFSKNFIGDSNVVSLIDLSKSFRLWELTYEQKFFEDKVSVRLGQMSIDRDFVVPELYNTMSSITLLNQTFFYPTMAFNLYDRPFYPVEEHALSTTPYATPGIRVKINPTDQYYLQAGVYGGNPDRSYHGTSFNLSVDEGALSYFETGFRLNMQPTDVGLPGSYKIGGYYHTDGFIDNDALLSVFGLPSSGISHDGNYGLYVLAEQMIFREQHPPEQGRQGLIAFGRFGYAPPDRNFFDWGADGGLVYVGLLPTRDYDSFAVAFSYLSVSGEIVDVQNTINASFPGSLPEGDYEAALEVNYKAQLTAWMTLQTSLQRVFHPGGNLVKEVPDAWTLTVQTSLRF